MNRSKLFSGGPEDEATQELALLEKNFERRVKAIQWVDKEIRKLIAQIQKMSPGTNKVTFGAIFEETMNIFEALSGTLVAAKKRGVVEYEGQLLMQGMHNEVVISLLRTSIEDSPLPDKEEFLNTQRQAPTVAGGFGKVDPTQNTCAVCSKTVYMGERVGAVGKVFHAKCFTCLTCKVKLNPTNFCCVNGQVYCNPHYQQIFSASGGKFDDTAFAKAPAPATPAPTPAPSPAPAKAAAGTPAPAPSPKSTAAPTTAVAVDGGAAAKAKTKADVEAEAERKKAEAARKKAEAEEEAQRRELEQQEAAAEKERARLAQEQAEIERLKKERLAREKTELEERERREKEEHRRKLEEQRERERKEKEEREKREKEEAEAARQRAMALKQEEERRATERRKREEEERQARAEEAARRAAEEKAREERARQLREQEEAADRARVRAEEERRAAEERERRALEAKRELARKEQETRDKAEKEALAQQRAEAEERERKEAEALRAAEEKKRAEEARAVEEKRRIEEARERLERERKEAEERRATFEKEQTRLKAEREKKEKEEAAQREAERVRREHAEKEARERASAAEAARKEQERKAAEARAAAEKEKQAAADRERAAREERERKELAEREARLARERREADERAQREADERAALERKRREREEAERKERVELQVAAHKAAQKPLGGQSNAYLNDRIKAAASQMPKTSDAAPVLAPASAPAPAPGPADPNVPKWKQERDERERKRREDQEREQQQRAVKLSHLGVSGAVRPPPLRSSTALLGDDDDDDIPPPPPPPPPSISTSGKPAAAAAKKWVPISSSSSSSSTSSGARSGKPVANAEASAGQDIHWSDLKRRASEIAPQLYSISVVPQHLGKSFRIVARMIGFLLQRGLFETDIFRVCFNPNEVSALNKLVEAGEESIALDNYSVNSVSIALKKTLHSQNPLIPYRLYPTLLEIQQKAKGGSGLGKYLNIAAAISDLPENNKKVLCLLFDLLTQLNYNRMQTKMSTEQLGYTFAPAILKPAKLSSDLQAVATEQMAVNQLVIDMLGHHDTIWENVILESKISSASAVAAAGVPVEVKKASKSDVSDCSSCSKPFNMLRWKIFCEGCGQIFCSNCCKNKAPEAIVGKISAAGNFVGKGLLCDPCHSNLK